MGIFSDFVKIKDNQVFGLEKSVFTMLFKLKVKNFVKTDHSHPNLR